MVGYVNVHAILEGRRNRAKASSSNDSDSSQVFFRCHSCILYEIMLILHILYCHSQDKEFPEYSLFIKCSLRRQNKKRKQE
jgi:hypothetical protein